MRSVKSTSHNYSGSFNLCSYTFPSSSALPFLHSAEEPGQTEEEIRTLISDDLNVSKQESVQSVDVYSMSDYAKVFVSVNIEKVTPTVSKELATEFLESVTFNEEQAEMINKKTVNQSQSQFWFDQRVGRIRASSFYPVCHLRESTDKRNTVKHLMNYCPIAENAMPKQLTWGHEKEKKALDLYIKKQNRNLISFPDLLWTKPKARSGQVRKYLFLDWLLNLTPVQSLL